MCTIFPLSLLTRDEFFTNYMDTGKMGYEKIGAEISVEADHFSGERWHLLRRALLSVTRHEFNSFSDLNDAAVLEQLLSPDSYTPKLPLKDYNSVNCQFPDSEIGYGETWVNDWNPDSEVNQKRLQSLSRWFIGSLFTQHKSLYPRLLLFWHQYFPIHLPGLASAREGFDYFEILRKNCQGSFAELVSSVLLHSPFLNTLRNGGKMKQQDSHHFARQVLSQYLFGADCRTLVSREDLSRFSHLLHQWNTSEGKRTDSQEIELKTWIHQFCGMEKSVENLSQRLFREFIYHKTENALAEKTINGLMNKWYASEGNISMLIKHLFQSPAFQDPGYRGVLVRSPIEFLFTAIRQLHLVEPDENTRGIKYYDLWNWIAQKLHSVEYTPGYPPLNTGWPSFLVAPYHQHWSTPAMQYDRSATMRELFQEGICFNMDIRKPSWEKELDRHLPESFEEFLFQISTEVLSRPLEKSLIPDLSRHLMNRHQLDNRRWKLLIQKDPSGDYLEIQKRLLTDTMNFLFSLPEYQLH